MSESTRLIPDNSVSDSRIASESEVSGNSQIERRRSLVIDDDDDETVSGENEERASDSERATSREMEEWRSEHVR